VYVGANAGVVADCAAKNATVNVAVHAILLS
jgi:hypothetical protein